MSAASPPRRGLGCLGFLGALLALGCIGVGSALVGLGILPSYQARGSGQLTNKLAMLASFIPLGWPLWLVAFLVGVGVLARSRRRFFPALIALIAAVGLIIQSAWLGPHFFGRVPQVSDPVTVLSLNVYRGLADVDQLTERAQQADIVVLVETTPEFVARLDRAGIRERFPSAVTHGEDGGTGGAIYSRYPITEQSEMWLSFQQWIVQMDVPGHGQVTVAAVHPLNPTHSARRWAAEGRQIAAAVRPYTDGPTIVAGDFNAVNNHLVMRDFFRVGLQDAAVQANAGWMPTWPSNHTVIPPLVEIDHVLVSDSLRASSVTSFAVDGTDHRGLLATVG